MPSGIYIHKKGKENLLWKANIAVKCLICKKEFQVKPYVIKIGSGKFCSRQCLGKWNSENLRGKNSYNWKEKILSKCLMCEKELQLEPYKIKCGEGKFCSRKCKGKWGSENKIFSGINNPNWKGGITPLALQIRHSREYREWTLAVFEQDDYRCRHCSDRGGRLEADHIKFFSIILSENKIKTMKDAKNCKELWNINNGQTLCKDCHEEKTIQDMILIRKTSKAWDIKK